LRKNAVVVSLCRAANNERHSGRECLLAEFRKKCRIDIPLRSSNKLLGMGEKLRQEFWQRTDFFTSNSREGIQGPGKRGDWRLPLL